MNGDSADGSHPPVSVLSDGATLDDPHQVTEAILDEFIEIRRAAGLSEELTVIESALAQA